MYRYRKESGGFYTEVNDAIPDDAVEITKELYQQLIAGEAAVSAAFSASFFYNLNSFNHHIFINSFAHIKDS